MSGLHDSSDSRQEGTGASQRRILVESSDTELRNYVAVFEKDPLNGDERMSYQSQKQGVRLLHEVSGLSSSL